MRHFLLTLALARTQHALPPRMGMLNRVLMQIGVPDPVETFEGSFYGVSAAVELNMRTRVALVRLNGVPIGGRISGTGWLKDTESESGTVVLEPSFEARLARRYVSIHSAHLCRKHHTVTVNVKIPVLGIMSLVLE
jgi:hypothetical protein